MIVRAGVLAAAVALLSAPSGAAPPAVSLDSYHDLLRWGRYWDAQAVARKLVAAPGLSDADRADLLVEGSRAGALLGDDEGVERDLKEALRLKPGDPEASYRLALILRDRPAEALPHANLAAQTAASPRRKAGAQRLSGEILLDLGRADLARAVLERALALRPDDLETLQDLVRAERMNHADAAATARRAMDAAARAPRWLQPAAYRLSARIWRDAGDDAAATVALNRALALEPNDLYSLEELVHIKRAHPEDQRLLDPHAGEALPPAVMTNTPDELATLGALVYVERARKDRKDELENAGRFMDAVLEAPLWQRPPAYRFITDAWLNAGSRVQVEQSLGLAKDLDRRSIAIEELTQRVGRSDFRKKTDPQNMEAAYLDVARARLELGDKAGAAEAAAKARQLVPGDEEARRLAAEAGL